MTAIQKYMQDHPEATDIDAIIRRECPQNYGYLPSPESCAAPGWTCTKCWNREIPDEEKAAEHKTKVICISGKARHGKDSTASILKTALESKGKKVLITHYGDLVKYVCKTFFDWNGEKDEAGRTLLQYIGTDCIRKKTPSYWVDFVLSILKHFPDTWDYVLIPDCRFPNEIECVKNAGWNTMHIRVVRSSNGFVSPLTEEQQNHISETALDKTMPDCFVLNYGDLDNLRDYVYELAGYLEGSSNDIH